MENFEIILPTGETVKGTVYIGGLMTLEKITKNGEVIFPIKITEGRYKGMPQHFEPYGSYCTAAQKELPPEWFTPEEGASPLNELGEE